VQHSASKQPFQLADRLWDLFCVLSVIGIWPRFIEPELLFTTHHTINIPQLPRDLDGLKILHLSDLHFTHATSPRFLHRVAKKIKKARCDLIVFTGDLITYSRLENKELLQHFLSEMQAPLGCYAILGNHDYAQYTSMTLDGQFQTIRNPSSSIVRGFSQLLSIEFADEKASCVSDEIPLHEEVVSLLKASHFKLLHNETVHIGRTYNWINLTGLGDIMPRQCSPQQAFRNYDMNTPGVILSHNPDSFELLESYPGNLYLFGHTHGAQVNLPYIWKRITPMKNSHFKRGLFHYKDRYLYINRGIGAPCTFRWFSPPEIAILQLIRQGPVHAKVWDNIFSPKSVPSNAAMPTPKVLEE